VTFHYRSAPNTTAARARVVAAVDAVDHGGELLRSGSGRALELRPPGASTKGDALRLLIAEQRPTSVMMLGDDLNDALAFDVLREARSVGRIDSLAVAVSGRADARADVAARADVSLAGPADTARLLWALADSAAPRR